jgi:hypothetical protein
LSNNRWYVKTTWLLKPSKFTRKIDIAIMEKKIYLCAVKNPPLVDPREVGMVKPIYIILTSHGS